MLRTINFIQYGTTKIEYNIIRSKRKTIGISISLKNGVKVAAPYRVSEKQIKEVVEAKAKWILKKLSNIESTIECTKKEYKNGEVFLYLGCEYKLKIIMGQFEQLPDVYLDVENLVVTIPDKSSLVNQEQMVKDRLTQWYRSLAGTIVKERISLYAPQINLIPSRVVIKEHKSRWGSCSIRKNININWKIVMAPMDVVDYVVVHELAHLKIMNHSNKFWNLVETLQPEYKERRLWLKKNGARLLF